MRTDAKSNEISAIPELLRLLELEGCIVTLDAMGCQKDIDSLIRDGGGDYVLALKANHGNLHHELEGLWAIGLGNGFANRAYRYHETLDEDAHGRREWRRYWLIEVPG